jgi:hypothetical protein
MLDPGSLPLPLPVDPTPEPVTQYVVFADGTLGRITGSAHMTAELPEGVKPLTQEAYEELRAAMRERHEARVAEMLAVEKALRRQQYEDLIAAHIPEATARSLSGHGGPLDDDGPMIGHAS